MATAEHLEADVSTVRLEGLPGHRAPGQATLKDFRVTEHQDRHCPDIMVLKNRKPHAQEDECAFYDTPSPHQRAFTCHPKNFQ